MKRLEGMTAVLTGAGKGIGREIARVFAHEGASLLLVDMHAGNLQSCAAALTATGAHVASFVGDVSNESDMNAMAECALAHFGRIDVLSHNAGMYPQAWLEDMTLDQWQRVINVNLTSAFLCVKACLPAMKKQNAGSIVMISSISGPRVGWPMGAHYTASKAGLNGFMKTAAIELAEHHINFNVVEPGNIATEGLSDCSDAHIHAMAQAIPMRRLGTPTDVAFAALFLASTESRYITGQSIIVDGGQLLPESHFQQYWK